MQTSIVSVIRKIQDTKLIKVMFLSLLLVSFIQQSVSAQCTVTGVSGSGFLYADYCAPVYTSLYYEFTFGTTAPPETQYRVVFLWGDGTPNTNVWPSVQTKMVGALTVYYLRVEQDHTFPLNGDCEYNVNMVLVDNGFVCNDSRQVQIVGNWHQDDVALANGVVAMTPLQEDVCEGLPLTDFPFSDVTSFACNLQDNPAAQKPNHTARHEQFVYGTNPVAGRGIPNLYIKVGTAQTIVYLTDASGNPVANSWTVDPVTGGLVAPYSTTSGLFEGPVVEIPVDGVTGTYGLNDTYPISFDGVGTVFQDQFQVTLRNWNVCNPWNGSQTNPNAGIANLATSLIYIIDGPIADAGPDDDLCAGDSYNMNGAIDDATSGLWTTTGDGSFTNATSPGGAVYHPGPSDIATGTVDLVLHAYGSGLCPEHTDIMTLVIDPLPSKPSIIRYAGDLDATFCDDGGTTSISIRTLLPSPNGIYRWERNGTLVPGATNRFLILDDWTQSGSYTVTVYGNTANQCPNESDPFVVTIGRPVTANITTPDGNICLNQTFSISASTTGPVSGRLWTTTGSGSFSSTTGLNTVYTPGAGDAGNTITITFTAFTNPPCSSDADQITLTVVPAPTVNAGPDALICAGDNHNIAGASASGYSGLLWTHTGAGSISGATTLTPVYNSVAADAGHTVIMTLTASGNSPCGNVSDFMQIVVDHTPVATANASQIICEDAGGTNLQGNTGGSDLANGATGFWTFPTIYREYFNDLPDGTTIDAGANSNWTRNVANTGGGWYSEVRSGRFEMRRNRTTWRTGNINIGAYPNVGFSLDLSSFGTGNGFESPQDYYTVTYYVDGTPTVAYTGTGAVDGSTGPPSNAFRTVNVSENNISGNTLRIEVVLRNSATDEYFQLDNVVVTAGNTPVIADPTNPNSAVTNLPVGSTVFTWTVSSANGACTPATDNHTVIVEPTLLAGAISGDQSICEGDNPAAFTSDSPASGGAAPVTYQWFHSHDGGAFGAIAGATNEVYTAPNTLVEGTHEYYREAYSSTGICGPAQTGTVTIIVYPGPTLEIHSITGDGSRCEDESITLTYAAVANATSYVWNFDWLPGDVNATTATPQITIDLSSYTFGSPFQDIRVRAAGINGCNNDPDLSTGDYPWSAAHIVRVFDNPVAAAGADNTVCGSHNITLAAVPTVGTGTWTDLGTGPGSVSFSDASLATAVATSTRYGVYTLQWEEDNGGCASTDVVQVTFYEDPTVTVPANFGVCGSLSTTLTATGHIYEAGSDHFETFLWEYVSGPDNAPVFGTSNAVSTTVAVDYYGVYEFRITETNGPGCSDSKVIQVTFSEDPVNASAGSDINAPCDALSVNLSGTAHPYLAGSNVNAGTQTWSFVSGPNAAVTFSNASLPGSQVTVPEYGNYVFQWTETNGTCTVSDQVEVRFFEDPDGIAGSGPYIADCDDKDIDISVTAHVYAGAAANHPASIRGWSYVSGPDNTPLFSAPSNPTTNVAVDNYGVYTFRWTETNGTCSNFVDVTVTYNENPSGASAGLDRTATCDSKSVNLAGSAHGYEVAPSTHTGSTRGWSYISGPDVSPSFTSPTSPTSEVVVDYYGEYVFEWSETNGNCTVSDQVTVRFYEDPVGSGAGADITADCDLKTASLDGTGHIYEAAPNDHSTSTALWTFVSGPGGAGTVSFADDTDPESDVTVTYYGTYVFRWTETNGNCVRSDDVAVRFYENPVNADAGLQIDVDCGDMTVALAGTAHTYDVAPNDHSSSTRLWTYVSGPDNTPVFDDATDPETDVTVNQYGVYQFRWTETNGNCTVNETVTVSFYEAPTVTVAPVADVCRDSTLAVIPVTGNFGGGASSATWSVVAGNGSFQNITAAGNSVTAEYVPTYDDILAGGVTLRLTTDDPTGPCLPRHADLSISINEAVYVVIHEAPSVFIAQGTSATITATISGAAGAVTTGTWTEEGALTGGNFAPGNTSNNITFTPTAAQEAAGIVVLRLTSDHPGTACGPSFAEITVLIGLNPVADAGPDNEDCEPLDSLIYLSGYAKASAGDANWSVVTGAGTIISQTKTWSAPQSLPDHDESDSLLVEAVYRLAPVDYGSPSTSSVFRFRLTTDDPDGVGPVSADSDEMTHTVRWSPKTPAIGGGGLSNMCVDAYGQFYSVPLTPGNSYLWEIEVLTGGGVEGTDYVIAGGGTGFNFIAIDWLTEGTYNLKVTETTYLSDMVTPCVGQTVTRSIGVYPEPVVTAFSDQTICIGETFNLTSTVTDGSGSYLYEWTPTVGLSDYSIPDPVVTGTFTGTVNYFLKVTDLVSGCESISNIITITTDPLPDLYTLSGPSYYCFGSATGATLTLSGSETNVYYQLINGATNVGAPVLGTGNPLTWVNNFDGSYYVMAVRDAVPACSRIMNGVVDITVNPEITMVINLVVDADCFGGNEGSISITPSGGTSPYSFLWSGPGVFSSTNEDITGLRAGDYTVTITDARGCIFVSPAITVSEPAALAISSILETQPVTCFGGNDGEAEVTVDAATGTAPYSYQWYYDASLSSPVPGATTSTLSSVAAATYYILITDANLCTVTGSITITQPAQITGSGMVSSPVSCNGDMNGEITVTAGGGSGTLQYELNGTGVWQGSNIFGGLGAGTYSLRARDANTTACIVNLPDVTVTEPAVLTLTGVVTSNYNGAQISCPAATDGIISVSGAGGTLPYQFNIDGGAYQGGTAFGSLGAGTYTMGILDARGCVATVDVTITAPVPVTGTATAMSDYNGFDVTCNGAANGIIEVNAAGGTGTLRYSINGGSYQLSDVFTGLAAGNYDISVRDANGCILDIPDVPVTEPAPVVASASVTSVYNGGRDVSCNGASDGEVTATAAGGTGVYTWQWFYDAALSSAVPGGTMAVLQNQPAGTYYVRVTDENGCSDSESVTINSTPLLELTTSGDVALLCNGDATATGTFTATGGTAPYTFNEISNSAGATINAAVGNTISFTGGAAGTVVMEVVDVNGCFDQATITISEPALITVTAVIPVSTEGSHNINCFGGSGGGIQLIVNGGTPPYNYAWSSLDGSGLNVADNGIQTGLTAGTYDVIITDANGCTFNGSWTLTQPPALTVSVSADDYIIGNCPGSDALLTGLAAGGVEPAGGYIYSWSPAGGLGDPSAAITTAKPVSTVTYTLTVTDANGCTASDNLQIEVRPSLTATAFADDNIIGTCPGSDATLGVTASGGEELGGGGYTYSWSPDNGSLDDITSQTPVAKPLVTTIYTVTVTDANGCSTTANVTITVAPVLAVTATVDDPLIGECATSTAQLDATVTGGEGAYTYLWDNAGTLDDPTLRNPVAKPIGTTTYTVTVTDANGCIETSQVVVDVAPPLSVIASADDEFIGTCPSSVANLNAAVSGGEAAYTYMWTPTAGLSDPFSATPVAKPVSTTTYTVTVTDANGCVATDNITITVQPPLTATATADDYIIGTCPSSRAILNVTAGGGEPGYTYSWSPAVSLDDPASQTPLAKPNVTTTYSVTVTDMNGCETTANVTIVVQPDLVATASADDYIIGTCPGSVSNLSVTVFGGEQLGGGGYTYLWDNPLTLDDASSRTPVAKPPVTTTYTVTVTDANGCTTTAQVTINVADPLVVTATASDNLIGTCPASTTTLMATVTGGEGGYTYLWDNAGTLDNANRINPVAKPLVTTTYTVTVTDANGCTAVGSVTVNVAPDLTATATADDYILSTCPTSVANLNVAAVGGEPGYSYRWSPTTGLDDPYSQTPVAKPASTTTYTVTVTDANGCTTTAPVTITVQPPLNATVTADDYIIGSCPSSRSNLSVTVTGGEELGGGGYTYLWDNAGTLDDPTSPTPEAKPLVTTTYTVTVTDANNCSTTAMVTIQVAPDITLIVTADDYIIGTCPTSLSNLDVSVSGGEPGYIYSWIPDDGSLDDITSPTPVAKPAVTTTYTVTVTDINGCQASEDITIVVAPDLIAVASTDDPLIGSCSTSRANLDVTVTGGEELIGGGYTYSWSPVAGLNNPFSKTPVAKPAVSTTYTVTVTDRNGCTTTSDILVEVADPLAVTHSALTYNGGWNVSCIGESDGEIDLTVTDGEAPYSYSWTGPAGFTSTDEDITGLMAGIYMVTVTDANGCIITYNLTLTTPAAMVANAVVQSDYNGRDVSCNGAADGAIDLTVVGGTAPYIYAWTGPAAFSSSDEDPAALVAGVYNVTVTDANGCTVATSVTLVDPPLLELSATNDQLLDCNGDNDGYGTFFAQGGTMPYTFTEVTNTAGATFAASGLNSQPVFGASAGIVTVRVTDANGCFEDATISFTEPDAVTPGVIGHNEIICFGDDPAALVEIVPAAGGSGGYIYQWQMAFNIAGPWTNIPGENGVVYDPSTGLATTTYFRREVRSGICTPEYSNPVEIVVNPLPVALITGGGTICPGDNSTISVNISQGTGPYRLNIDGLGPVNGYSSGVNIPVSPAVTTTYTLVSVEDANGCIVTDATYPAYLNGSATVIVRDSPVITRDPFDVTLCEYNMTGFGVNATGTDLMYQWEVFDGSNWSNITDGGTYFGANSDSLMIFSATRSLNGFLYRVKASTCGDTVTSAAAELTIETAPEIINHPDDTTICVGNDAWMDVVAVGSGLAYQWYVNTGAGFVPVVDDGVHYAGATTDSLIIMDALPEFTSDLFRVVVSGTCGVPVYSSFSILTVSNPPVATLDPLDDEICENGNAYFVANGYGMDSIRWQMDDGSGWTELYDDVNHLGSGSPQLTIIDAPVTLDGNLYRLALYNECDVTYTGGAVLTVNDNPVVDFSAVDPLFACGGVPLQLDGNPTGGSGTYINHRWTGQIGPLNNYFIVDPVFTTGIQGSYALNYMVTDDNGCSAAGSVTVEVERPTASFAPDVTSGCPDLTINFTDNSIGAVMYRWDFGDGTAIDNTAGDVSHTYTNDSTSLLYYNVKLEVESVNGCIDSMIMGVTVYPKASADFTLSADTVCSGDQVIFTSLPGAYQYHWDYGDGVAEYGSNVINHVFVNGTTAPVTYTIRLTTSSFYSCDAWIEKEIVVYPTPVPLFSANPPSQVYPAATVSFTNLTTGVSTWDYLWKFDDGNSSTEINPVHTYAAPGNYNVYLIVSNGVCSDSINRLIQVLPTPPVPMFDSIPGGCSPYTVTMTNRSLYATTYMWEFGDGGVSNAANPTYTYYEHGTFRITLTATGPGGTRQFSRLIQVYETPRAYFEVSPSKVFVDDERVRGFNLSQGADYYIWEWGDGDTSMVKDPYHKYMHEGIYDITLHAYSNNGCYNSYTLAPGVTVEPAGDIRFANVFRPNKEGPHGGDISNLPADQVDILFFPPVKDQVDNYKLQIFNRSGVLIFESNDINIGWDGYYKGKLCMQGVYVWYVEGNYANGKPFKKVGDITLLH